MSDKKGKPEKSAKGGGVMKIALLVLALAGAGGVGVPHGIHVEHGMSPSSRCPRRR